MGKANQNGYEKPIVNKFNEFIRNSDRNKKAKKSKKAICAAQKASSAADLTNSADQ